MAALAQLETAYDALRHDPVFWADLRVLLERFAGRPTALYRADRLAAAVPRSEAAASPARGAASSPTVPPLPQARGPRPHRRAQDQQRARPGAAHPSPRQDPGHRRDRRRPARRRDGDGLRAARPAVRRLHGRRGHRAPGSQRPADARARRGGAQRDVRDGDAQGRGQRGDARLGHQRRDDPLRAGLGDGSAPVPDDRARPPATDRRRGGRPAARRRGSAPRPRPRVRRRRLQRDRAAGAVHRRADASASRSPRPPATGCRPGATRRRSWVGRPASSTARARSMLQDRDGQVVEAHSASAGLDYPGIGPQLAALAEGGRLEVAAATDREAVAAMKATTRTEGILPALETVARDRGPAQAARRGRWPARRLRSGPRGPRAARVLRSRRQGPRRPHPVRRRRAMGRAPDDRRSSPRCRAPSQERTTRPGPSGSPPPSPGRARRVAPRSSRTSSPGTPTPRQPRHRPRGR